MKTSEIINPVMESRMNVRRIFAKTALFLILMCVTGMTLTQNLMAAGYIPTLVFGTYGSGNGQLACPKGIKLDISGNIYVVDSCNNRIQKFSSSGIYLSQFGTYGTGNGQFAYPYDIAIDSSGNIYVSDTANSCIQKFSSSGTYLSQFGTYGTGNGQLYGPYGIAIDSSGNIYVAENGNKRIQKFSSSGTYLSKFGTSGTGNGQFDGPTGIAIDSSGNIYVADSGNKRIQKFSSSGTYLSQFGSGNLGLPNDVTVDSSGNIFVADNHNNQIQKWTIIYNETFQAGTGGTISPSAAQTVVSGGSTTAVTATANSGYTFTNWTNQSGTVVSTSATLPAQTVTSAMIYTANFTAVPTYTVNFTAGTGGTVSPSAAQTVASGGSTTPVTATANSGYTFTSWTNQNGIVVTTNTTLPGLPNVTSNMFYTANFTAIPTYTVNFTAGTGGTIFPSAAQTVASGGSTTAVTASANSGYTFVNWTGTGGFTATTANPLTVSNITANMTVTANFQQVVTHTVTFAASMGGTVSGSTSQILNQGSNCTAITATANSGYQFVNWTGTGGFSATTANPLTVSNVTADMVIIANFQKVVTHTVTFAASMGGTVSGSTSQIVNQGSNCTAVTAAANSGYQFVNWTGTGGFSATTANPLTVSNVTADMVIIANFQISVQSYTVTFMASNGGSISGSTSQTVNQGSNCTAVTAVPDSGYQFAGWNGTGGFAASMNNPLTVLNVTADMVIIANFQPGSSTPGDISGNGVIGLDDAILGLQVMAGLNPQNVNIGADVNGDNRIGIEEVIFILQKISGLR